MIDWATYRRVHPESFKHHSEYQRNTHEMLDGLPASMTCDDEPSEKSLLLLPPFLNGFNFQEKKWSMFPGIFQEWLALTM